MRWRHSRPDVEAGPEIAEFEVLARLLEAGAYELLKRTARRADDERTALLAERILSEEQAAAEAFAATWDAAVSAALAQQVA